MLKGKKSQREQAINPALKTDDATRAEILRELDATIQKPNETTKLAKPSVATTEM